MTELADKIEAASGPSRELDAEVAVAVGLGETGYGDSDWTAKPYTASLDAAMTLVPEGREWRIERRVSKAMCPAYASIWTAGARDVDRHDNGHGKTPALALVAAALRAGGTDE